MTRGVEKKGGQGQGVSGKGALGVRRLALLVALAACGAYGANNNQVVVDAMGNGDAPPQCMVTVGYDPLMPVMGSTVRATAYVSGGQIFDYTWTVSHSGITVPTTFASADKSQIDFVADTADVYDITASVNLPDCIEGSAHVTVLSGTGNSVNLAFRSWPPSSLAPTQEQVVQIFGGGNVFHPLTLDPGIAVTGTVTNGTTGIPAYVRFMPGTTPDAYVETFTAANGSYSVRLQGVAHTVLIVPEVPGLAPKLATWSPTTSNNFALGAGTVVSGTVLDGTGNPLAGAHVQLTSGGVPSSLATTAADGSFSLHEAFTAGAQVAVDVVPPAGRGLPRLAATGAFNLGQPLQIHYASLATCDVGGAPVQRGGAAQPGAQVTFAGALAGTAGTVTAGTTVNATGTVHVAATADGTGHLPSTLVPRATLSAVAQLAAGDLAVSSVNLATCPPTAISAPPQVLAAGSVLDPSNAPLDGVRVVATGNGALAGNVFETSSAATTGAYSLALPAGGSYDVRFVDPLGRAAPLAVSGVGPAGVPAMAVLLPALHVKGTVSVSGSSNPLPGVSVQVLCVGCTGTAALQPLAETATDATSSFIVAVPDPGTM